MLKACLQLRQSQLRINSCVFSFPIAHNRTTKKSPSGLFLVLLIVLMLLFKTKYYKIINTNMFSYFKLSKFFLIFSVFCIPIVMASTLFPFIVGKYVWFRMSVDFAFIFFLLGLLLSKEAAIVSRKLLVIFKQPLVIAVTIFVIAFLLACFFGINPHFSFWSNFERGEGGFQMIHLWIFFILLALLFDKEENWRKMFFWFLISGVLMAIYGLFAGLGAKGFVGSLFSDAGFRFQGSIGNPAYVAAFCIFMIFYCLYLLFSKQDRKLFYKGNLWLWGLILVFLAVFFSAATRGAFIGLMAAIVAFLGYLIIFYKPWRVRLLILIIVPLLIVGSLVYFKDSVFVKSIPGSRVFDISITAKTFQDRTIMWGIAWQGFKERPVFGWGPENFIRIFDKHFDVRYFNPAEGFGAWFDRAHSVYFDYLAETGIVGLVSYLMIFLVFYWQLIKSQILNFKSQRENNKKLPAINYQLLINALLFAVPTAYLVQGIVLFDVLPIYLNLFLLLAFANYKFNLKSQISNLKSSS